MSRIFLSHSSADNFEAVALRDWLASEGWDDVFLDLDPDRGIAAGERWERSLHAAASRCEAVIFIVSGHWLASDWCLKEYTLARGLNKKLFAVLVDPNKSIADLPAALKDAWQVVGLSGGQDMRLFRATLPGSHEEKHVGFSQDGLKRLKRGLAKAGLDPKYFTWPPDDEPDRAPYRGLKPLDAPDAGIFFGRDAPIVEAIDRLRGLSAAAPARLMAILGASGAGKSSFLRAGLIPRLARDDAHFLPLAPIRPERAALYGDNGFLKALETAFPDKRRADLRAALRGGAAGVRPLLAELVVAARARRIDGESATRAPMIVIAIDQAEELFRAEGIEESAALLELLRDLAVADAPAIIALFAIRSDSYDALEHAKALEGLPQATMPLLPMPRGAYKEVIEGPARRVNEAGGKLAIEPQLSQRLLEDIERGGGADALPLLAFTLEQLYLEYHQGGALRLVDYEAFGGLKGAIDAAVERAFGRADADARIPKDRAARAALLRRGLIPWLAGVDPDSKSPRRNIARRSDIPPEAAPLIDLLVEERLLSTDSATVRDPQTGAETRVVTIEPAHEALLRQWGLLEGWLKEDFGLLATLEGVKRASRDWEANARAESWLAHQGQRLDEAQGLDARPDIAAKLDPIDRAYLAACRAKEDKLRAEAEQRRREREEEQERQLDDARKLAAAERKTVRRTRVGLGAALILAIAAGAFGFVAQREKTIADAKTAEAKEQRDRAQRSLTKAIQTANTLVFDLAQRFRHVSGVQTSLVKAILEPALKLQGDLIGAGESDPSLRYSQSAALNEMSLTLLTAGDFQGALAAAMQSHDIMAALAKDRTGDVALQQDLAVSLERVGDAKQAMGDRAGALSAYEEETAIRRGLAADNKDAGAARDLSVSLSKVGDIKLQMGDLGGALALYEEALKIRQGLADDKTNAGAQRDLSIAMSKVGDAKLQAGERDAALALYEQALAISRELAADKTDARAQFDLSTMLERVGAAKLQAGDQTGGLAAVQEALDVSRDLAQDKSNFQAQHNLAVSLERVGDAKKQAGDIAGALAAYSEEAAVFGDLAKDKTNIGAQKDLSASLIRLGGLKLQAGDLAGAEAAYAGNVAVLKELAKDKAGAGAQQDLAAGLITLGDAKLQAGDQAGALAAYAEALDIGRALATNASSPSAQRDLAVTLNRIGDAKLQSGDHAGALAAYEEALAICRSLASDKANAQAQLDLSFTLEKIGKAKLQSGDTAGALAAFADEATVYRELAKDKTNVSAERSLAGSLLQIGDLKLRAGDPVGAAAAYEEALAIWRDLARDATDAATKRGLAVALNRLGDALFRQAKLAEALDSYKEALAIAARIAAESPSPQAKSDLRFCVGRIDLVSGEFLLAHDFAAALDAAMAASSPNADQTWPCPCQAHALMFLGRDDEARAFYLAHRGEETPIGRKWETAVLSDFAILRQAGLTAPLMGEIEKDYGAAETH
ncbi:MAG TPA: toll/interleukin-1 receptor domain-containing protein [Roseiarcus sp.]|nr:toll/interleukin-1 receptor domain-containing protein [Roseiarcus sp.]